MNSASMRDLVVVSLVLIGPLSHRGSDGREEIFVFSEIGLTIFLIVVGSLFGLSIFLEEDWVVTEWWHLCGPRRGKWGQRWFATGVTDPKPY